MADSGAGPSEDDEPTIGLHRLSDAGGCSSWLGAHDPLRPAFLRGTTGQGRAGGEPLAGGEGRGRTPAPAWPAARHEGGAEHVCCARASEAAIGVAVESLLEEARARRRHRGMRTADR